MQFSRDRRHLATGSYDHDAVIWNADDATVAHRLAGHTGVVMSVAFSPDGATLATASIDRTVKLWKAETGALDRTLDGHRLWVNSVAFFRDGKRLVSGSSDGMVIVWSAETGEMLQSLKATNAEVRRSPSAPMENTSPQESDTGPSRYGRRTDGPRNTRFTAIPETSGRSRSRPTPAHLASGDGDWNRGGFVTLRDPATGRQTARFQHTGEVLSVAFSPTAIASPLAAAMAR